MVKKLKIMDWLVHGGHQYEFFKTGHYFYCTSLSGEPPAPAMLGRPYNVNVQYVWEKKARLKDYNIIMIRAGLNPDRYNLFRRRRGPKPVGIAVMQTYLPYDIPRWTKCVVWNSKAVMSKYKGDFPWCRHFYIPHGFSPNEFYKRNPSYKKNGRILSVSSLFEQRKKVLGFDEWRWVSDNTGRCDLLGHGNDHLKESVGTKQLDKLVKDYNEYSVFLNTTTKSAMPRARGEALMCGMPLVTTNNFGIDNYLKDGENCLFADTKEDMLVAVNKILKSEELQKDLGNGAREAAIKYFNINDYVGRWQLVFEKALL